MGVSIGAGGRLVCSCSSWWACRRRLGPVHSLQDTEVCDPSGVGAAPVLTSKRALETTTSTSEQETASERADRKSARERRRRAEVGEKFDELARVLTAAEAGAPHILTKHPPAEGSRVRGAELCFFWGGSLTRPPRRSSSFSGPSTSCVRFSRRLQLRDRSPPTGTTSPRMRCRELLFRRTPTSRRPFGPTRPFPPRRPTTTRGKSRS